MPPGGEYPADAWLVKQWDGGHLIMEDSSRRVSDAWLVDLDGWRRLTPEDLGEDLIFTKDGPLWVSVEHGPESAYWNVRIGHRHRAIGYASGEDADVVAAQIKSMDVGAIEEWFGNPNQSAYMWHTYHGPFTIERTDAGMMLLSLRSYEIGASQNVGIYGTAEDAAAAARRWFIAVEAMK